VIVVDGGAPESIRAELREIRKSREFDLVESEGFILPNEARNIALDRVRTKYVVFCDNDLSYEEGWLEALERNAEQNRSAAVCPVTLIGPSRPPRIHHAGGTFELRVDSVGRRRLEDQHHLENVPLPEAEAVDSRLGPLDHQNFEYHCVLVDTELMRAVGGHDERLIMHEHLDSSLRLLLRGGRLTFEPAARVTYRAFVRFTSDDWPYFLFRWAIHRAVTSDRVFAENWGIYRDLAETHRGWIKMHRDRAMSTALPRLPKALNRSKVRRLLLAGYRAWVNRLDTRLPDRPDPHVPPALPPGALQHIGINPSMPRRT
jgi:GT2 family glycosyltransferase